MFVDTAVSRVLTHSDTNSFDFRPTSYHAGARVQTREGNIAAFMAGSARHHSDAHEPPRMRSYWVRDRCMPSLDGGHYFDEFSPNFFSSSRRNLTALL